MSQAELFPADAGYAWQYTHAPDDLLWMLAPIARSAAALLTSDQLYRVGECADLHGCGWLFYDTSRNRSRRWCSMDSCGNRAKAQRHYQRASMA
jgi:predicted RNA-binding Zn ribbon-like protein